MHASTCPHMHALAHTRAVLGQRRKWSSHIISMRTCTYTHTHKHTHTHTHAHIHTILSLTHTVTREEEKVELTEDQCAHIHMTHTKS